LRSFVRDRDFIFGSLHRRQFLMIISAINMLCHVWTRRQCRTDKSL